MAQYFRIPDGKRLKSVRDEERTKSLTIIKNPSRKLEEHIRKIGVQKYLWLERLCSDEVKPTKVINLK